MARTSSQARFGTVAAVIVLAAGCRTTSVATQNLDAVLGSNDTLRYQGDTTSLFNEVFAGTISRLTLGFAKASEEAALDPIKNPTRLGLENLLMLSRSRQGPRAWRENEQVRVMARYARFAPSQLLRERALIELGAHGKRLGVEAAFELPERSANAADLMVSLDGLVDATKALLANSSSETAKADFDAAVALLERADYDVQGGTRLLRAIGPFLRGVGLPGAQREALEGLSLDVQRRCVREALQFGLIDRSPVARAAAFHGGIEAFGEPFLVEATLALVPSAFSSPAIRERFNSFGIPSTPPNFTEVFLSVAAALQETGLPEAAQLETVESKELERVLYSALHFVALNDLLFPERARNAAMRALGVMAGGELVTYREEEWDDWFKTRADQLGTEIQRLRAEEGQGEGSGSS